MYVTSGCLVLLVLLVLLLVLLLMMMLLLLLLLQFCMPQPKDTRSPCTKTSNTTPMASTIHSTRDAPTLCIN